jgi:ferredoxin
MQPSASGYNVDGVVRRVVDGLLRGGCRGKVLCARCLVKLMKDHLDESYTTREIGNVMDHVFEVPGPIMRLSTSPCVVCLRTTMPCLGVPAR